MTSRYGLEVRGLLDTDASGLLELLDGCVVNVESATMAARIDRVRAHPGVALVATTWGPLSGLVVAQWRPTLFSDALVARLELIYVAPDERRHGIGRILLKSAAQAARQAGCDALHVDAHGGGEALLAFCETSGFDQTAAGLVRQLRKRSLV